MVQPQMTKADTDVAFQPSALAPATHKHDFSSIADLVREERIILSEFPIAVSYLLSLIECEQKGETNGTELTYGMRGQPSSRARENIAALRALEEKNRSLCDALTHPLPPDTLTPHVVEFHKTVGEQRALLGTIRLSALDAENITELLTTKSLPLPEPLREWELSRRRRLNEIGEEFALRIQPIYEAFIPQLSISIKPYAHFGLEHIDLYQEACRGLIKAIRAFNPKHGAAFPSYLKTFLHNHLYDVIVEQSRLIRLSPVIIKQITELRTTEETLTVQHQREPTIEEVAVKLGITTAAAWDLRNISANPTSLDAPVDQEDKHGATMHDILRDDRVENADHLLLKAQLLEMIQTPASPLKPRERSILIAYFGLDGAAPQTSDQLAKAYGITTGAGIRYLISGALKKLEKWC